MYKEMQITNLEYAVASSRIKHDENGYHSYDLVGHWVNYNQAIMLEVAFLRHSDLIKVWFSEEDLDCITEEIKEELERKEE